MSNPDVNVEDTAQDLFLEAVEALSEALNAHTVAATRACGLNARALIDQALNKLPDFAELHAGDSAHG